MTRTHAFHASLYLCLASASLCLASAELFFLPWMPGLLLTLWIAFFIAWKFEGRWQLSDSAANYLGLLIAFTMLGWLVFQLPRTEEEFFAAGVPWPAGLLPHLGPLLMILTAVKLYRPKRVPDFWVMQLLGLMMVTLASVLAGELHHGLWLVAYLLAAHWCVYLYFQMRPAWVGLSDEEKKSAPLFPVGAWQDRQRAVGGAGGLGMASVWTLAALFLGMGLFFFAPRLGSVQWIPHQLTVAAANRLYTGPDPSLDLNRTGKIELSDEVAFEVSTQDAEGRTVDLPSDMYWRTETLDFYQNGRWFSACHTTDMWPDLPENGPARAPSLRLHLLPKGLDLNMGRLRRGEFWPHPSQRPAEVPADLVYLTFRIKQGPSGALVLAEPPDLHADERELGRFLGMNPYANERSSRSALFTYLEGTDTIMPAPQSRRFVLSYGQAVRPDAHLRRAKAGFIHPRYREFFLAQPPPEGAFEFTQRTLFRLAGLTEAERTIDDSGRLPAIHHARVAQALCGFLAHSEEYFYSLDLRRHDRLKDPILDFLVNVKEGHCQRYASGLALMLRSLGIPCRIVQGFRGAEKNELHSHLVRFRQAHSWVQVLVPGNPGNEWLTLDPTPSQVAPMSDWQSLRHHLNEALRQWRTTFRDLILDYSVDHQVGTMRSLWHELRRATSQERLGPYLGLSGFGIALGALFLGRKRLSRWWRGRGLDHDAPRVDLPWMCEIMTLTRQHLNVSLKPSQTYLEFADDIARAWPSAAPAFDTLARYANQVSFGGLPLNEAQHQEIAAILDRTRSAFASLKT